MKNKSKTKQQSTINMSCVKEAVLLHPEEKTNKIIAKEKTKLINS